MPQKAAEQAVHTQMKILTAGRFVAERAALPLTLAACLRKAEELGNSCDVLSLDLPGHGQSAEHGGENAWQQYVPATHRFVVQHGLIGRFGLWRVHALFANIRGNAYGNVPRKYGVT